MPSWTIIWSSAAEEEAGNHRNGYGSKTVITDTGKLELAIPRDRHGRFDPVLIGKYRRRFAGFDDKIIALYARGMTTREIAEHIGELYGAEISADLVSAVTDSVLEEVAAWQSRGLDATYAIVFFDALRVKIRNEGMVNNRAVYLALGVRCSGHKEILGHLDRADRRGEVLAAGNERAAQPRGPGPPDRGGRWAQGISRGDHLGVSQDRGPNLHRASDPVLDAVHLLERTSAGGGGTQIGVPGSNRLRRRASGWRSSIAAPWGQKYPAIAQSWRRNWEQVIPFFAFAPEVRKILYTTNAIESLNAQVRKAVRIRGHFPSEEAATKLIYLVLRKVQTRWKNPPISWQAAKTQLAIQFEDRFQVAD